jgi:D-alanyl-D-alanine carboxypeptidase
VTNGTSTAPLTKVVSRVSTSDAQNWGISIGKYPSRYAAEKMLLKTALAEIDMLQGSLRKVRQNSRGFEATFLGLSQSRADQACKRLQSRDIDCSTLSPS